MKAKTVKVCPDCDAAIVPAELETKYQCGECDEVYDDRDDAKDCCKE